MTMEHPPFDDVFVYEQADSPMENVSNEKSLHCLGDEKPTQIHRDHNTLQGTNISHLGKRKIIFKSALGWDMLVPCRVSHYKL